MTSTNFFVFGYIHNQIYLNPKTVKMNILKTMRNLFYLLLLVVFGVQAQEKSISGQLSDKIPVDRKSVV